jgi:pyruvate formate lyase activating enzyme
MDCFWCQNPESQSTSREIFYYKEKCIDCGNCVSICPEGCHYSDANGRHVFDRVNCTKCGECVQVCNSEALGIAGKKVTYGQIMEEIIKDMEFYQMSGGGVTLSGGEPLLQLGSCYELLRKCRELNIGTALDTAGNVDWSVFQKVLPVTDYFLYDIKTLDEELHLKACGVRNKKIIENLRKLLNREVNLIIRIPVIPGVNDSVDAVRSIAEMVSGYYNVKKIELLQFHNMGRSKYRALGREYRAGDLHIPGPDKMTELNKTIGQVRHNIPVP